jgi:hypothetical protein
MNEREATVLLERLGGMLEVSGAPVERVVDAGKLATRRRRRWQIGGAAAAVAAVVVGAGVIAQDSPAGDKTPPTSHTTPSPTGDEALVTPPGTRLVGENGVVVAVPESFSTEDLPCGIQNSDTVTFRPDFKPKTLCTISDPRATLVTIADSDSPSWQYRLSLKGEPVDVDGLDAVRSGVECQVALPRLTRCAQALTFPESGVSFLVGSPRTGIIDRILDSAQAVPDGYVTVPSVYAVQGGDAAAAIEAAGLEVDPACSVPECLGYVAGTVPPTGTPVKGGAAVSLRFDGSFSGGIPSEDDLLGTWRPSRIGDGPHIAKVQKSGGAPQTLTFKYLYQRLWFTGSEGCNDASGHVLLDGWSFSTSQVGYTLVGCPSPRASIAGIVTGAAIVTLDNGHLRFYDGDANLLATFVRVPSGLD